MEKQTKILLGIASLGAIAYLIYKNKSSVSTTTKATTTQSVSLITPRQQNINDMFSTTDAYGVIKNTYSGNNNSKFDDYVIGNEVTQEEVDAAKKAYPNAELTKANYLVANAKPTPLIYKPQPCMCITTPCNCGGGEIFNPAV